MFIDFKFKIKETRMFVAKCTCQNKLIKCCRITKNPQLDIKKIEKRFRSDNFTPGFKSN